MHTIEGPIHVLNWHEFEELVQNHFDIKEYNYVAYEEVGNDSQQVFFNYPKKVDEYEEQQIVNGEYSYCGHVFLSLLIDHGVLQPGTYIITVSW